MALFKQKIKIADTDYTASMLPQTRKQVFFDVFKLHWFTFLGYGLLFLLFSLLIHFVAILEDSNVMQISQAIDQLPADEQVVGYELIRDVRTLFAIIKIPALVVFAIALSGFARVIRQYAWEEVVFFKTDFFTGIKTNGKQFVLLALLVGVLNVIVTYCYNCIALSTDALSSILWSVPLALFVLLAIPTCAYATVAMSIYNNRFFTQLKISFLTYVKNSWKTLLVIACCAIPFVPQIIPVLTAHIVGRIISPILSPFVFLAWYLFSLNGFDDFINAKHYPSLVGRGTFSQQNVPTVEQTNASAQQTDVQVTQNTAYQAPKSDSNIAQE